MTEEEATRLFKKTRNKALKMYREEADDIAQTVVLNHLKNPRKKQTAAQGVKDWYRSNIGKRASRKETKNVRLFSCIEHRDWTTHSHYRIPSKELHKLEPYLKKLKKRTRAIIVLTYVWGLEAKEIAYCFDIDDSRVVQILTEVKKKLGNRCRQQ